MKKAEIIKKVPHAPFKLGETYEVYKFRDKTQCVLLKFSDDIAYQAPREAVKICLRN
jgi:hypothetical protein